MNQENVAEEAAERRPAAQQGKALYSGGVGKSRSKIVAFKFGGSSLLGAERMLHAARLVREAAEVSRVAVVVSAMKGVTDHLLSIEKALASGRMPHARREAEVVLELHLEVLQNLRLDEETDRRVRHELQLLGCDLLHEVLSWDRGPASAEFSDRLVSFGERFSARLVAAALQKLEVASVPVSRRTS